MFYFSKPNNAQDMSGFVTKPTHQAEVLRDRRLGGSHNYQRNYPSMFLGWLLSRISLSSTPNRIGTQENQFGGIIRREQLNEFNFNKPYPYESE